MGERLSSKFHVVVTVYQRKDSASKHFQVYSEVKEFETDAELARFLNSETNDKKDARSRRIESFLGRLANDLSMGPRSYNASNTTWTRLADGPGALSSIGRYIKEELKKDLPFAVDQRVQRNLDNRKVRAVVEEAPLVEEACSRSISSRTFTRRHGPKKGWKEAGPSTAERIRTYLGDHPAGTSVDTVNTGLGIHSASAYLLYMIKRGMVRRETKGGKNYYYLVEGRIAPKSGPKSGPDAKKGPASKAVPKKGKFTTASLKALLSQKPGLTATEIYKHFKVSSTKSGQVTSRLKLLTDTKTLRREGRPFRYSLAKYARVVMQSFRSSGKMSVDGRFKGLVEKSGEHKGTQYDELCSRCGKAYGQHFGSTYAWCDTPDLE
jgi:hypothetical protein